MTTIREALAAVRGETEATVAPILQALQAEGFDVDAEAGDAFCLLDVSYLRSHLNLRQLTALKAAIKMAPLHVGRQTTLCTLSGDRVYDALMLAPATLLQEYAKQAGLRLWMGPWSYVELEAARGIMFSSVSKAKLSELYARWGGIPRYVLKYAANPELQEELDAAVATVNMDLLWKSVGNIEAAPDVSHKLIHVE
ncbi:hypothetical protein VOLCADRAFT_108681, partial [Volvox carteri f. nagariensis]